ncbi:MAG: hypothetical protein OEO20_15945 [Gemmatimonadota bacterium]|nr:hypothetical protein [Gemmatimonadota bacterium]MDH3369000.1 hypothetical protein [Gemmatimonadota bacterium]MDH3479789.1 hypothetical protein [Gemmatimonadota bacterium]MDH3569165.1 hypothetical protein [Gemmatimonadota bacterium]MDH5549264.1 hypothetical protein [Gemmatimonadota bacterium]
MRSAVLPVILVLASFTDAVPQELPLQPGQRVRVTAPDLGINKLPARLQSMAEMLVFLVGYCLVPSRSGYAY